MITSERFDRLKYHFIKSGFSGEGITDLLGLDSEAYVSGAPFLFGVSDGRAIEPETIWNDLLYFYSGRHFALWNLKYDSGAILYDIPPGAIIYEEDGVTIKRFTPGKYELWTTGRTRWKGLLFEYIPHKYMKISRDKNTWIKAWDIQQFFSSSLDFAANKYLAEKKFDLEIKEFTPEYYARHREKIISYCIQDARLTARLGNFLLCKLAEFNLRVTSLYSQASISFRYFQDTGKIVGIRRYWKHYKDFLRVVIDSYQGGKFEITARGYVPAAWEYDITSAYPYEIANLVDIDFADICRSTKYQEGATYAFLRVRVRLYKSVAVPCGLLIANMRVYAIGEYYITITGAEYHYLLCLGAEVEILDGWYLFVRRPSYPYRDRIMRLFELKNDYKGKDEALYSLVKIMMNGFYGKTCQVIPDWKGNEKAGVGFNPVYASVITANTRIKVCRMQNSYAADCMAVHTDSVIMLSPLPPEMIKENTLGEFSAAASGPAILVACGCYQIGNAGAFKGFEPAKGETWHDILYRHREKNVVPYRFLTVESWIEATAKGHFDKINRFDYKSKDFDLNADIKRLWHKNDMTAGDYLRRLYTSDPVTVRHDRPPEYWRLPAHSKRKVKKWTCSSHSVKM